MRFEDVYWPEPGYGVHKWRHAYFRDNQGIGSGAVAKNGDGTVFRLNAADRNQTDMTPLQFKCWLLDKQQVPPP